MKKLTFLLCLLFYFTSSFSQTYLNLAGTEYRVDTLNHITAGPGSTHTYLRLYHPDYPLRVSLLKIDASHPNVHFESVLSNDLVVGTEKTTAMAKRKTKDGAIYFAGINGDFFHTSGAVGTPTGGHITGGEIAKIPVSNRGVIGLTKENYPITNLMVFKGTVTNSANDIFAIHNINGTRVTNKLTLYNSFNGTTTKTDDSGTEILISVDNDKWSVSSGSITATVLDKRVNKGNTPISKKQAVLSGTGDAKTYLDKLNIDDKIKLDLSIYAASDSNQEYPVSELLGGDEQVLLKDGVWTGWEWDGSARHPRSAMGYSADRKTIYYCVVDGRAPSTISPRGVNMQELAQIMLFQGAYEALNLDGGGSSCLYVEGLGQVNRPSDGNERAVSNAMFAVTNSPKDTIISKVEFKDFKIEIPRYTKIRPTIYGYNQYDILTNKDVTGVVFSCDSSLGHVDEKGYFIASGNASEGVLTATYNGASTTKKIIIAQNASDITLKLNNVLIDNKFEYKIEAITSVGTSEFEIDARALNWTVEDESICKIENGILTGLQNGQTKITGVLDTISRDMNVTVEISADKYYIQEDFKNIESFKIKPTSNLKNFTVQPENDAVKASFKYSSDFYSTIDFEKDIQLFSLPDTIIYTMNTGNATFSKISLFLLQNNETIKRPIDIKNIEAGKDVEIKIPVKTFLTDSTNIAAYPLHITKISFYIEDYKYVNNSDYYFFVKNIKLVYNIKDNVGIEEENIFNDNNTLILYPNPIKQGEDLKIKFIETTNSENITANIFSTNGILLYYGTYNTNENLVINTSTFPAGSYIIKINQGNKIKSAKFIIK